LSVSLPSTLCKIRCGSLSLLVLGASCGSENPAQRELRVFAASSLTNVFQELEKEFELQNPETAVSIAYAGSQVLRLQIAHGAPADVFASANTSHMQSLHSAGLVENMQIFTRNELAVVLPLGNPAGIVAFEEVHRSRRLVVGSPNVPIGAYTREAFERAATLHGADFRDGLLSSIVSEESNARLVRAKVELGEADAAIVYGSDAAASDRVIRLSIPPEINVCADYTVARTTDSRAPEAAMNWIRFLHSDAVQNRLLSHGFRGDRCQD
jgi:molybdate transport system substrate-binding protein